MGLLLKLNVQRGDITYLLAPGLKKGFNWLLTNFKIRELVTQGGLQSKGLTPRRTLVQIQAACYLSFFHSSLRKFNQVYL